MIGTPWLQVLAALGLVAGASGMQAPAGNSSNDTLTRRATERLKALHEEADGLALEQRGVLGQLRQLEIARQIANEELRQADAATVTAIADSEEIDRQVVRVEEARDVARPKLESRLVDLYKLGRGRYVRLLMSAADVRRLGQAARTVAALAASDQSRIRTYAQQLVELAAARRSLVTLRLALVTRRTSAAQAHVNAARAVADQNALAREIDQRRDLNAQLASELQAVQEKLEETLRDAGSAGAMTGLPIGPFRGALPWPANGPVQPPGGASRAAGAQRPGLEIQALEGSPVRAVYQGVVAFAGSFEGLGNLVIVDHGSQTFTLYGHLIEMGVGRGVPVADRQVLGRVGRSATGNPGLYFELRVNGHPVDPLLWLERPH